MNKLGEQDEQTKEPNKNEEPSSHTSQDGEGFPPITDSQFPNTQDLFGADTSSE